MRIVGGKYKRRRFDVPHTFKARPTTDFAKENLFNVLGNMVEWDGMRALDLFSGTGSIALEFASRGCREVVCIEKDRSHYAFICKCIETLKATNIRTICIDAFRYLKTAPEFDFVFADPPYSLPELASIPNLVLSQLRPQLFVLEHGKEHSFRDHPAFLEERVYGSVHFTFMTGRTN